MLNEWLKEVQLDKNQNGSISMHRCYTELKQLKTFEERLKYLKLNGKLYEPNDGLARYLNQDFYRSKEWRTVRNQVVVRDLGCDLGIPGYDIYGKVYVHHMNPIMEEEVLRHSSIILDPEVLITVSYETHNAIHYGLPVRRYEPLVERSKNDTIPWK